MTEKRFKLEDIGFVYDNDKLIGMTEIVDLLNELDEKYVDEFSLRETLQQELQRVENENEELKLLVQNWESLDEEKDEQLDKQNQALKKLKKEIESWKQHCITHGIAVPITWGDKND